MTFIIGLRFLTDFVDGDPYFRTLYPDHNLDRAKVQFRLVEQMELNAAKMQEIVLQSLEKIVNSGKHPCIRPYFAFETIQQASEL
jgi:hypothetical protein